MRTGTYAQIQILPKEQLHFCAMATYELVQARQGSHDQKKKATMVFLHPFIVLWWYFILASKVNEAGCQVSYNWGK